jgi:hypothetical protein
MGACDAAPEAKKNKKKSKKKATEPTAAAKWEKVEERFRPYGIVLCFGLVKAIRQQAGDTPLVMVFCDTTNGLMYFEFTDRIERYQVDEPTRQAIDARGGDFDAECVLSPPEPGARGVLDDWIEEPDFFN